MIQFFTTLQALLGSRIEKDDKGASMVEYGLLVALIAVVVALAATVLGEGISQLFTEVEAQL